MGDLTPRQRGKMEIAAQAEAYVEHKQTQRHNQGGSISHSQYDVEGSRREWEQSFK